LKGGIGQSRKRERSEAGTKTIKQQRSVEEITPLGGKEKGGGLRLRKKAGVTEGVHGEMWPAIQLQYVQKR